MPLFTSKSGKNIAEKRWRSIQEKERVFVQNHINNFTLIKLHSYLASDGYVGISRSQGKKRYEIGFYPDSIDLANDFINLFKESYGKKPAFKKDGNYYRVTIRHKTAYLHLSQFGKYNSKAWRIPFNLLDSIEKKAIWISAFIDCDGHVSKKRTVQIQSVNNGGILQIQELLKQVGIKSTITKYKRKQEQWSKNYILTINASQFKEAQRLFTLLHPEKRARLLDIADVA